MNYGSLVGDVILHGGDDLYVAGRGGTLAGALWLEEGDDLIVVENHAGLLTVADFSAGAGTDDMIDLSAIGIDSFAAMLGHATEDAGGVTLDFGTSTLVLASVTLASLSPDDFMFEDATAAMLGSIGLQTAPAYNLSMV